MPKSQLGTPSMSRNEYQIRVHHGLQVRTLQDCAQSSSLDDLVFWIQKDHGYGDLSAHGRVTGPGNGLWAIGTPKQRPYV